MPHGGLSRIVIFTSFFEIEVAIEPERLSLDGFFSRFKKDIVVTNIFEVKVGGDFLLFS